MEPGYNEVVYSTSEMIGLPDWSFVTFMASAKNTVLSEHYDAAFQYLFLVVNEFIKERTEVAAVELMKWSGLAPTTIPKANKDAFKPNGFEFVGTTEITFSRKETIGMPNKSKIDILASNKSAVLQGTEWAGLEELDLKLSSNMKTKRDIVLAKPRPWVHS